MSAALATNVLSILNTHRRWLTFDELYTRVGSTAEELAIALAQLNSAQQINIMDVQLVGVGKNVLFKGIEQC